MTLIVNHLGDPVKSVTPGIGFYKYGVHFYHVHSNGIAHLNVASKVINHLDELLLADYEVLMPISRELFEQELRSTIFDIGIYEYVKSI